jgi:hypothetical protein
MNNDQKDSEWSGFDPEYNFPKSGKRRGRPPGASNIKPAKGRLQSYRKYNAKRKPMT